MKASLAGAVLAAAALVQNPVVVPSYVGAMVTPPPAELKLDPFYTKYADAAGIPIVASEEVRSDAVLMLRDIVNHMLVKRPDLRAELVRRGSRTPRTLSPSTGPRAHSGGSGRTFSG